MPASQSQSSRTRLDCVLVWCYARKREYSVTLWCAVESRQTHTHTHTHTHHTHTTHHTTHTHTHTHTHARARAQLICSQGMHTYIYLRSRHTLAYPTTHNWGTTLKSYSHTSTEVHSSCPHPPTYVHTHTEAQANNNTSTPQVHTQCCPPCTVV